MFFLIINPWNIEKLLNTSMNSPTAKSWPCFTCCYRKLGKQCSILLCSSSRQCVSHGAAMLSLSWWLRSEPCFTLPKKILHGQSLTITQVFIAHKMLVWSSRHILCFALLPFFFNSILTFSLFLEAFQIAERKDGQVSKHLGNLDQLPAPDQSEPKCKEHT